MDGPAVTVVGGVVVEVEGSGEPVAVLQTALGVDELRPLARRLARHGVGRVLHVHRPGYAGSRRATGTPSVAAEAAGCRAVLDALDDRPAHVVGASYSAALALTLAASAPERVLTLTVVEPPPAQVPGADGFRAANARLLATAATSGPSAALEELMSVLSGPGWRAEAERDQPGSVAAMERDAGTFFAWDVPALVAWDFGPREAGRVRCPVLHVGGGDTGPWFAGMRARLLALLPQLETVTVPGAGHLVASTHPAETAAAVAGFLRRHRRGGHRVSGPGSPPPPGPARAPR